MKRDISIHIVMSSFVRECTHDALARTEIHTKLLQVPDLYTNQENKDATALFLRDSALEDMHLNYKGCSRARKAETTELRNGYYLLGIARGKSSVNLINYDEQKTMRTNNLKQQIT